MKTKRNYLIYILVIFLVLTGSNIGVLAAKVSNETIDLPNRTLKYGERSGDVKEVQRALNKLGYKLSVDGSYGPNTRRAVLSFQRKYSSLSNDGIYGPSTRAVILKALKGGGNIKPPADKPDKPVNPSKTRIETRGLVYKTGISSDGIRLLKDFFRARKEANVPYGYHYDNRTRELVRNYQKSKGLGVDGIAGPQTIASINKDISQMDFKWKLRKPQISPKGDMIIINKSSNTLYFFRNGLINESYPVATGKTSDLTPNGKFKIVVKYKNPYWGGAGRYAPVAGGAPNNPLGKRWLGISLGGGGVYGVHGNAQPSSIGTYASLGCVRMFNSDVERLYEKVRINTPIWIGNEPLLESYGVKFK